MGSIVTSSIFSFLENIMKRIRSYIILGIRRYVNDGCVWIFDELVIGWVVVILYDG